MAFVNASCTANTSAPVRSKASLQSTCPSVVLVSCAVRRIRSPARRTVPSTMAPTPSVLPTSGARIVLPLNEKLELRPATRSPGSFDNACASSSVSPSLKYSSFASPLVFTNGNTASDDSTDEVSVARRAFSAKPPIATTASSAIPASTRGHTPRVRDGEGVGALAVPAPLAARAPLGVASASSPVSSSRADCGRCAGSFSRQRMTSAASGGDSSVRVAATGIGASVRCATNSLAGERWPNGEAPVNSS